MSLFENDLNDVSVGLILIRADYRGICERSPPKK